MSFDRIDLQSNRRKYKGMRNIKLCPSNKLKLGLEKPKPQVFDISNITQMKTTSFQKLSSNQDLLLLKKIKNNQSLTNLFDKKNPKQSESKQKSAQYRVKSISTGSFLKQKIVILNRTAEQQKSQFQKLLSTFTNGHTDPQIITIVLKIIDFIRKSSIINFMINNGKADSNQYNKFIYQNFNLEDKQNLNIKSIKIDKIYEILQTNVKFVISILIKKLFQQKKSKLKIITIKNSQPNQIEKNELTSLPQNSQVITTSFEESLDVATKTNRQIEQLIFIKDQYHKKQLEINQQFLKIEELNQLIASQQLKLKVILNKISQQQIKMKSVLRQANKICNFVDQQNNKLIKMASQEYKEIQAQIYDYAAYLQSNQLATSLTYQPLAYQCITNDIDIKMKNINKLIIQDDQLSITEKNRHMRDFVMETISKFKKKDEKQSQLLEFKTKCIVNFVKKMKRWLDNWSLKQQYLVNLRNQFASNSPKMQMLLVTFKSLPICAKCSKFTCDILDQLIQTYDKIDCNYKLGNSFY